MDKSLRCARCTCSIRFCPHCGTPLTSRREGVGRSTAAATASSSSSGGTGTTNNTLALCSGRAATTVTPPCDGGAAMEWQAPGAAWRCGLPDRHVSAYEVYRLVSTAGVGCKRPTRCDKGASRETGDTGIGSDATAPTSPLAEDGAREDVERGVALSWLRLSPTKKRAYEVEAQTWASAVDAATTATAAAAAAADASAARAAPPLPLLPSHEADPAAGPPTPALPASTTTDPTTTATAKKLNTGRTNSFNLFRAGLRGQSRLTITGVAALWRHMTPAEKAPYDAAAARLRTEAMLAQGRQAPSASGSS